MSDEQRNDGQPLSAELRALEDELAGRARPECSPQMRGRILQAVRRETSRAAAQRGWVQFTAAMAATVLLVLNLALLAGRDIGFPRRSSVSAESTQRLAAQLREVLPELSPKEAERQAVIYQTGGTLSGAFPAVRVSISRAKIDF